MSKFGAPRKSADAAWASSDPPGAQRNLRLVMDHELTELERAAQFALDAQALQRQLVHRCRVEAKAVAPAFLGPATHTDSPRRTAPAIV